jgi:hypothetical protein
VLGAEPSPSEGTDQLARLERDVQPLRSGHAPQNLELHRGGRRGRVFHEITTER